MSLSADWAQKGISDLEEQSIKIIQMWQDEELNSENENKMEWLAIVGNVKQPQIRILGVRKGEAGENQAE